MKVITTILEYVILAFFVLVYMNVRLIKAFHPNITLHKFKVWYQMNYMNDFAIVFFAWLGMLIFWLFGLNIFLAVVILLTLTNGIGLILWFVKHRLTKK